MKLAMNVGKARKQYDVQVRKACHPYPALQARLKGVLFSMVACLLTYRELFRHHHPCQSPHAWPPMSKPPRLTSLSHLTVPQDVRRG